MKNIKTNFALSAIIIGLFLTFSQTAQAATFTVNTIADNGTGGCTAAECTLREAIVAANGASGADVIEFSATVFNIARTITLNGTQLLVSGALTINGTGANLLTVSGNNAIRVFSISGSGNIINGITITSGNGTGTPFTGLGGGIFMNPGTLILNNTVISNNTNNGIYSNSGTITVNNSTLSGNSGGAGGAIFMFRGPLTMTNSTVNGNTATNEGGGIYIFENTATLTNTTVSGNSGSRGGGIYNIGATTLTGTTVSNNTATTSGGGIYNDNTGTTTLNNSIIANSTSGGDCVRNSGTINASYSLIEADLTCVSGTNSNNLTGDPNLGALANNGGTTQTHELLGGSIAIDKGNSTLMTDQRGAMRPVDLPATNAMGGNGSDIGAFEVQVATAASVSIGGRVMVSKGRGLTNAVVYLTDSTGEIRMARTNTFGYYRFYDLAAGQTVIITIVSKRYQFAPQVVSLTEDIENLNFFAGLLNY